MAAPLTPRQRKKGLVLPLSEDEAVILRATLGPTSDHELLNHLESCAPYYKEAIKLLKAHQVDGYAIYLRLDAACRRRGLER